MPLRKIIAYIAVLVSFDQLTKFFAKSELADGSALILDGNLGFELTQNYGIAFGLSMPFYVIILSNISLLILLSYIFCKEFNFKCKSVTISYSLIFAGAIGNLIDRFTNGYVVDFIKISIWPNFNLADSYVVIGVLLILLFSAKIGVCKEPSSKL
jgi:signal peptidase II